VSSVVHAGPGSTETTENTEIHRTHGKTPLAHGKTQKTLKTQNTRKLFAHEL
jgi:hypothetical protein